MAAFISVSGIAAVFITEYKTLLITAIAIELSKLALAGFVYRMRHKLKYGKIYWYPALIIMIIITSAGIFGFLTSAYKKSSENLVKLNVENRRISSKLERFRELEQLYMVEKDELIKIRDSEIDAIPIKEESRYYDLKQRNNIYNRHNPKIETLSSNIYAMRDSSLFYEDILATLEVNEVDAGGDIGPILYIADSYNIDRDTVANWFILALVIVFDPLAISLIIGYNMMREEYLKSNNSDNSTSNKSDPPNTSIQSEDVKQLIALEMSKLLEQFDQGKKKVELKDDDRAEILTHSVDSIKLYNFSNDIIVNKLLLHLLFNNNAFVEHSNIVDKIQPVEINPDYVNTYGERILSIPEVEELGKQLLSMPRKRVKVPIQFIEGGGIRVARDEEIENE